MCKKCERQFIPELHTDEDEYWDIQFACVDCKVDTRADNKDYYTVTDEIWKNHGVGTRMLCIACLEKRLGRILIWSDFTLCLLNLMINQYVRGLMINHFTKHPKALEELIRKEENDS